MGIESDQLVFDYLSRVGDLAQQRQLPSATRMRLVTELRGEIDRHRAQATVDSPAAVRRILDRLGSPDRIVSGAQGGGGGGADPAAGLIRPLPEQRAPKGSKGDRGARGARGVKGAKGAGLRRIVPLPRRETADPEPAVRDDRDAPSPPHLAGTDELGASGDETDWWRIGAGGAGTLGDTDSVPGFTGGVEIPEILKRPGLTKGPGGPGGVGRADLRKPARAGDSGDSGDDDEAAAVEGAAGAEGGVEAREVRGARRLVPRRVPRVVPVGGWTNPLLLLAAVALVAGAALGNILALLIGWAVVYLSRRLTLGQKKLAVFGLPGLAVIGGIVWLWGRSVGKWGAPIADGQMSGALGETWPWVLRVAAVGSALYLVWRSQRSRG
ncbi:hypothetical protein OKJ48_01765 [Streptomyces kunmingensis]|uniref:Integral membrane protein n=1 Tax=Streptomyces kunmingensis TaxID=68225 RepID=A0ABU6C2U9_9ACTN|nr:hypothetical protein [Streptomyces kunmingensis]MEB3958989.1 hypothetical protein [Streptomyces kunmingensis]